MGGEALPVGLVGRPVGAPGFGEAVPDLETMCGRRVFLYEESSEGGSAVNLLRERLSSMASEELPQKGAFLNTLRHTPSLVASKPADATLFYVPSMGMCSKFRPRPDG